MAQTTPFTVGVGAACTGGVCGKVSRAARGMGTVDAAGTRRWPRLRLILHRGAVIWHG